MDTASFAFQPLIDLTEDAAVPPSLLGQAVLHWAGRRDHPASWSADRLPPRALRGMLAASSTVDDSSLFGARMACHLGDFERAAVLADTLPDKAWRELILSWCADGDPGPFPDDADHVVRFAWLGQQIRHAPSRALFDTAAIVAAEVAEDDRPLGLLATARLAGWRIRAGQSVDTALLDELAAHHDQFLFREAEHEIRLAMAHAALSEGKPAAAAGHAEAALALDPSGAPSHLLMATVAKAQGRIADARRHYRNAARLGLVERGDALAGLLDLDDDVSLIGAVSDLLTINPEPEPIRTNRLRGRATHLLRTDAADTARWLAGGGSRPLPLERFRPFLDLRAPQRLAAQDVPPVTIHTPLMSLAAVREHREPWFHEIHPQRATPALFRAELAITARRYGYASAAATTDYHTWLHADDGCPADLRDTLEGSADLPMLDRAMVSRLLSALGFYPEAKAVVPEPSGTTVSDPETAYAVFSWLFAELMYTTGQDVDLDPWYRALDEQLGTDVRYARMKVVITIHGSVLAARRREPDVIAYWRAKGERALADYVKLSEVDDFNGALMTSRWYRAVGFLPYLTGDKDLLTSDMDRWLGIARDLVGHDEDTRIIAADNYFPAVETAIRTHTYLGHHDVALRMVDELTVEIDPIDPKTWLTAGELRFKAGDVTGALAAYQRAAHLEFPFGRLSWFNAGQCHEKLGHFDEAVECYRRSLDHWPTGVTPLRRIRDLHVGGALGTGADAALVAAWARRQPAWSSLPPVAS